MLKLFKRDKAQSKTEAEKIGVIVIADTHINSTNALCPRVINLDDGGTYTASRKQHMLIEFFEDFLIKSRQLTEGYKRVVVIDGDIGDLDSKERTDQLITRNRATILKMMTETLEPLVDLADILVVMRGTVAHSGKSSWLEEMFAADFKGTTLPSAPEIFSHYHFRKEFSGVKFDVAHHGKMGGMRHTQKAYAARLAQETLDKYRDRDESPPDIVIRAHNHRRADSGHNWPVFAVFTPSWQLQTEYAYRIGLENDNSSIGGDIFLCEPPDKLENHSYFVAHKNFVWYPIDYEPERSHRVWEAVEI